MEIAGGVFRDTVLESVVVEEAVTETAVAEGFGFCGSCTNRGFRVRTMPRDESELAGRT